MVKEYRKPAGVDEALELLARPGSAALAGGTYLLAFEGRDKPELVVDLGSALSGAIARESGSLRLGALATFQEILESDSAPAVLKAAAASMANRNTRNRATVGGNLGARKSCSSLAPILLALGATLEVRERGKAALAVPVADWLERPRGLILSVTAPLPAGVRAASLRASRTACDIATATAACAYRLEGGKVTGLRVAVGGFGPRAAARPDIAALFEGKALPPKADIEKAVAPLLSALSDMRGGADYKKLRGAALVADALHGAEALA